MNKFINWLEHSLAPKMNKLMSVSWIKAISGSMFKILPFIFTGSLIFIYNVLRSYLNFLPDATPILNYSFGILALIVAFTVASQFMEETEHNEFRNIAGLTALVTLLMVTRPEAVENGTLVDFSLLGATGFLMGIIVGILVGFIFLLFAKMNLFEDNYTFPDFITEWVKNILPIFTTLLIASVLVFGFNLDLNNLILTLFSPILKIGESWIGLVLIIVIPTFFYSLGISTWFFYPLQMVIFLNGIQANMDLVAAGQEATNIVTNEVVYSMALISLGGTGATLPLNVLMLRSKSTRLKQLARVCIVPSLFNINEPINYGTPIVFNPLLMIPMWICSIVGPTIIWFVMKGGLLNIPAAVMQIAQVPAPISSVLVTEDLRAIIWWIALFIIYGLIWYPFFKAYENKAVDEERLEEAGDIQ